MSQSFSEERCELCYYFRATGVYTSCHYNPPMVNTGRDIFPIVPKDSWCGKFRLAKKEGVYGVSGQCAGRFRRSDIGFDPEIEKARLKEERENVKTGKYGIIGSPYDPEEVSSYNKADKEPSLLESILRSSCDPGSELGKALDEVRNSFDAFQKEIKDIKPIEKLGGVKVDLDSLYKIYKGLPPEVKKELEEISGNLSAVGRVAHEKFFAAVSSLDDFLEKKKDPK